MRSPIRTLISTLLLICVLSGCGQKAPLYLPNKPAAQTLSTTK
ncbi:LPS translocon maturation chaperone LptM [Undibacterium griseum]|uniref:Lipoprotein n=1 Tax=Undibacterium griseum TaxID=2762295 RepID=A0ABR6YJ97_9BURK|nr:lipoprotein [Undibacterium griseum]MBC3883981.1 lipoprotein [Undibacterium griseum]